MNCFFEVVFRSPFSFFGTCIILGGIGKFILTLTNRIMRHANIRKHGYPPAHCDADGDIVENE